MPGKERNGRGQGPMVSGFPGFSQEAAGMEASGKRIYLGRLGLYLFLFLLSLGCVARILPWQLLLAVVITGVWIADRSLFLAVDYSLLLTFCAFFVFIGNMGRVPAFCRFLGRILEGREIITCVGASQIISNVPSAILISHFSNDWAGIALGTNVGAVGTPISSLATLITLRQYQKSGLGSNGKFIARFEAYNFAFLVVVSLFEVFVMGIR